MVDLVRSSMVQLFAFEVDFGAAKVFCRFLRKIKRRRTAYIILGQRVEFCPEGVVRAGGMEGFFDLQNERHEGFRHVTATIRAEMAALVGAGTEGIRIFRRRFHVQGFSEPDPKGQLY